MKFKAGVRVRTLNKWKKWSDKTGVLVKRKGKKANKIWEVAFDKHPYHQYIHEDHLVRDEIYYSPLYKALL